MISISLFGPTVSAYLQWDIHEDQIVMQDLPDDEGKKEKTEKEKQEKKLFVQDFTALSSLIDCKLTSENYFNHVLGSAYTEIILPPPEQLT